jgi:hypothetical protein
MSAPAKRRYKILKRSDQSDPEVLREIASLEAEFPELIENPPPKLSDATRATLEGGALVSAIERGEEVVMSKPQAAVPPAAAAAAAAAAPAAAASETATTTADAAPSPEEVKRSIAELDRLSKKLQQEIEDAEKAKRSAASAEAARPAAAALATDANRQQQAALDQVADRVALMVQLYTAFYTFRSQHCALKWYEALAAIACGMACAVIHVAGFAGLTLCDASAAAVNPVFLSAWAAVARAIREFGEGARASGRTNMLLLGAVLLSGAAARAVLLGVIAFVAYALLAAVMQIVGVQFPPRFCAE